MRCSPIEKIKRLNVLEETGSPVSTMPYNKSQNIRVKRHAQPTLNPVPFVPAYEH